MTLTLRHSLPLLCHCNAGSIMTNYSVKKLAKLSGVSVRTLHHYDKIGLLKPSIRTEARYRLYGERELLRLQQILFYKELDFPLKDICEILDNPAFSVLEALESHKVALHAKLGRINQLLVTVDKTINHLKKGGIMLRPEELYEGLNKETAEKYRQEAMDQYGQEAVETSENELMKLGKTGFEQLKTELAQSAATLFSLREEDPASEKVQTEIATHYHVIRQLWGTVHSPDKQAEAYAGLGKLYVSDERFTMMHGKPQPAFADFLSKAMDYFAKNNLR